MNETIEKIKGIATADNTGYTAHFIRPNSAFSGTSYSPKPLYAIRSWRPKI